MISPERLAQVKEHVPDLFTVGGSLLYVGASPGRCQLLPELKAAGYRITLLEVWPSNAKHYLNCQLVDEVITGDVREILSIADVGMISRVWDVLVWWHGPEHLNMPSAEATIRRFDMVTRKLIVLATPWGPYDQGPEYGNPYEVHLSTWRAEHFDALGYEADALPEGKRGNLLAWRRL